MQMADPQLAARQTARQQLPDAVMPEEWHPLERRQQRCCLITDSSNSREYKLCLQLLQLPLLFKPGCHTVICMRDTTAWWTGTGVSNCQPSCMLSSVYLATQQQPHWQLERS